MSSSCNQRNNISLGSHGGPRHHPDQPLLQVQSQTPQQHQQPLQTSMSLAEQQQQQQLTWELALNIIQLVSENSRSQQTGNYQTSSGATTSSSNSHYTNETLISLMVRLLSLTLDDNNSNFSSSTTTSQSSQIPHVVNGTYTILSNC